MHRYVFLHGSPGNAASWDPLVALAPPTVSCTAWDLLDHGDGPDAPDATLDDIVRDVVTRVRALEGTVTLVGHSFGAWVAGRALAELGERVTRYVAIAGMAALPYEVGARSGGFADALDAGVLTLSSGAQAAIDLWLPSARRDEEHAERVRALVLADRADRLARVLRRHAGMADPACAVAPSKTPATILHNVEDRAVPIASGRELARRFENGRFVELPGDSHFPHWTDPATVARIVFA